MRLLKKGIPFIWGEQYQCSFDRLKHVLTSTPLLKPPNYNQDFILYLATYGTTIRIVLVQTDEDSNKHVIYYLNKGLVGDELHYPYVEKFSLETIFPI